MTEEPGRLLASGRDGGDRVVHLDLHPLNVLYGPTGPVLIDWTNARRAGIEPPPSGQSGDSPR